MPTEPDTEGRALQPLAWYCQGYDPADPATRYGLHFSVGILTWLSRTLPDIIFALLVDVLVAEVFVLVACLCAGGVQLFSARCARNQLQTGPLARVPPRRQAAWLTRQEGWRYSNTPRFRWSSVGPPSVRTSGTLFF